MANPIIVSAVEILPFVSIAENLEPRLISVSDEISEDLPIVVVSELLVPVISTGDSNLPRIVRAEEQ